MGIEVPADGEALRAWLAQEVVPWWLTTVAREPAGFVEFLTADGLPDRRPAKTPLVTARLIYCFSHAHVLGLGDGALDAAERGFDFLTRCCWDASDGGFFHQVDVAGAPLDRKKDAYDHAFALFAMAWLHRATGKREPLDWANRTIEFMDAALLDRSAGGYREHYVSGMRPDAHPLPRRQNPHMHLLEAFLALYEGTGNEYWRSCADAMVELFTDHFFDCDTGTLGEYYDADLRPAVGRLGQIREPGHHFEWFWLLRHHARLFGVNKLALSCADRLYRFGCDKGIDRAPNSVVAAFDEADQKGRVLTGSKLFWPQTEAIKAFLARWEFLGDAEAATLAHEHTAMLFRHYLVDRTGRWHNQLSRNGAPIRSELPVRVLYHLFLMLTELLRLWSEIPSMAEA